MRDFGRMLKQSFARRIAYVVAALVMAALLQLCGMRNAHAQAFPACGNNPVTCTKAQAADAVNNTANKNAQCVSIYGNDPGFVRANVVSSTDKADQNPPYYLAIYTCTYLWPGNPETTISGHNRPYYYKVKDCATEPELAEDAWIAYPSSISNAAAPICVDGCGFKAPEGSIPICTKVDGQDYCRVGGFKTVGSEHTCAVDGSSNISLTSPPADKDGDGISDGNDQSPNHPGQGNNGPNAPQQDDGGKPNPDKPGTGPDGKQGNGPGEGSGNGNKSGGGGNCSSPPVSTGDAIGAQIAYQAWATRCAVESLKGSDGGVKVSGGTGGTGTVGVGGTGQQPEKTRDLLEAIKNNTKKGEGNGGGCTPQGSVASFACSGDAVGCIAAEKLAVANCREQAKDSDGDGQPDWTQGDEPDVPGDGDDDYEEPEFGINVGTGGLDTDNFFGGGGCPAFSITVMGHAVSSSEIPQWCTLVSIMRAVVLIMGAYTALQILMGKFG